MSNKLPNQALQAALARAQKAQKGIEAAEERHVPVQYLRLDQVEPSPYQARRDFHHLEELAEDIRQNGILQPILVRPVADGHYQLVAGERRWRASRLAEQPTIPAVIRELSDVEARQHGLRENLQREDLNSYEMARAIVDLIALQLNYPVKEVEAELGSAKPSETTLETLIETLKLVNKDLTYFSFRRNYLSLLRLPTHLIQAIEQGASYSAILALRAASQTQQIEWLPLIISGEWSRRQVQEAIKRSNSSSSEKPLFQSDWDIHWQKIQHNLTPRYLASLEQNKQHKIHKLLKELANVLEKK